MTPRRPTAAPAAAAPAPTIAQRVAAYQTMTVAQLLVEYERLFGQATPVRNRTRLWRTVAWKAQELHYGGLPADAAARLEQIIDEHIRPMFASGAPRGRSEPARELRPGTVLTRAWHGAPVRVEVTDAGFVWNGVPYASLTAAARAITGQHWNGKLFFGLTKRSGKGARASGGSAAP